MDLRCIGRRWPWLLLVALSVALHLWGLGERSFHHDESIHAHGAWNLLHNGIYRYDPTYHGPLLYYLTASTLAALDSDLGARLPVAVAGMLLVGVAWCLRRPLGERSAWWTGLLATISPSLLYYGRFLRMDVLEVATASAAAVAAWRAAHGRPRAWLWAGAWAGLAVATKENSYVTAAIVAAVWLLVAMATGLHRALPATVRWLYRHRLGLAGAAATAVLVTIPLYTVFFHFPGDWFFPGKAITYWWGQHSVERVAGPPWYHLPRLALYEFLPVGAAFVWVARRRTKMRPVEVALILFGVTSVAMYFYLGEKVPWLLVHQVWAFLPLAGAQLARTFGPRGRWWSRAVAATALAATLTTSLVASFVLHEISPRRKRVEALVYVQTCPELLPVVREARQLAADGANPAVAVAGEAGWPLTWYWRDAPVWWDAPQPGMHPPIVLCDPHKEAEIRLQLGPGYTGERIPLRAWWPPPDDFVPGPTHLLRYVLGRLPWSVIGSADVIVLRRSEEPVTSVREAPVPEPLASELGVRSAKVLGEQWLAEPRGVAVAADGTVAVADPGLSAVLLFDDSGGVQRVAVSDGLSQPEAVAWAPEGALVIADTWGHRVLVHLPSTAGSAPLPDAPGGWYGPRGVAVAADGTVAVSDTGNKRVVAFARGAAQVWTWGEAGTAPGQLEEPVGLAWIDNDRLLVCDTGNRRVQVLDREGRALRVVELPAAWSDFYARPQVAVIAEDLWVVTDPPAESLFLVRGETVTQLDLGAAGIAPSGVAWHAGTLYVTDLNRRLWVFE